MPRGTILAGPWLKLGLCPRSQLTWPDVKFQPTCHGSHPRLNNSKWYSMLHKLDEKKKMVRFFLLTWLTFLSLIQNNDRQRSTVSWFVFLWSNDFNCNLGELLSKNSKMEPYKIRNMILEKENSKLLFSLWRIFKNSLFFIDKLTLTKLFNVLCWIASTK